MADGRPTNLFMHQLLPEFSEPLDRAMAAKVLSLVEDDLVEDLPVQIVSCGFPFTLVPVRSLDAVQRAKVRLDLLEESENSSTECKEILIFTQETEKAESDVHCRMFAPRLGVPEDPATGGAHGPLGAYLFHHKLADGQQIMSEQGYEMGRPSRLIVKIVSKGGEISDVAVGGDCVAMGQGSLQIAL